jgi:hypothetical protein
MMNAGSLRRFAASMYEPARKQPEMPIKSRPLPGNELVLTRFDGEWRLALRREETPIAPEDAQAVADAFLVPDEAQIRFEERREVQTISQASVPVFYVRWAWQE